MVSLGEELKRERELRDISLREISEATKISIRILEAIERNNFRALPGGIFNRNFLRAYADFIGIDSENVVRKYNQQFDGSNEHAPPVESIPGVGASILLQPQPEKKKGNKWLQIVLILILLTVVGIYFYFNRHRFIPRATSENRTSSLYDMMIDPDEHVSVLV
jgi:cytoskeletal protein RodZ